MAGSSARSLLERSEWDVGRAVNMHYEPEDKATRSHAAAALPPHACHAQHGMRGQSIPHARFPSSVSTLSAPRTLSGVPKFNSPPSKRNYPSELPSTARPESEQRSYNNTWREKKQKMAMYVRGAPDTTFSRLERAFTHHAVHSDVRTRCDARTICSTRVITPHGGWRIQQGAELETATRPPRTWWGRSLDDVKRLTPTMQLKAPSYLWWDRHGFDRMGICVEADAAASAARLALENGKRAASQGYQIIEEVD